MSIKKYTFSSSLEPLADAIRDTGIFETVTFEIVSGGMGEVKCYDANNVCRFVYRTIGNDPKGYTTIKWTLDSGEELVIADGSNKRVLNIALSCSNGLLFGTSTTSSILKAALTKTNNNSPCLIIGTDSGANYNNVNVIACDDVTPITNFSFPDSSQSLRNQCTIVPFSTNASIDHTSYTPNAGFLLFTMYDKPGYGKLINGNDVFITDGYWCIYDEAPSPES